MTSHARATFICLFVAAVVGAATLYALGRGIGVSPDSVQYFHYARVLLHREPLFTEDGLSIAVTHYPPLYPAALAVLHARGLALMSAARAVNTVAFAATAVIAWLIALRAGGGVIRAMLVAALVVTQPAINGVQLWALSEPLFFIFLIAAFAMLIEYRSGRGRGRRIAILIGATLGAAVLTRYVGVALLPPAAWIIWRSKFRPARRADAVAMAATAAGPIIAMAAVQRLIGGSVGHRSIEFHPITTARLAEAWGAIENWLIPADRFGTFAPWAAAAMIIAVFSLAFMQRKRSMIGAVALPLCACYVGFLLVSVAFFDNATPLDDRLLSPVALLLTIWLAVDLSKMGFAPAWRVRCEQAIAALIAIAITCNSVARTVDGIASLRTDGLGFDHIRYRQSPLISACRTLPKNAVIYSNFPEAIWLQLGREARILPGHPTELGRVNNSIDDQMAVVHQRLKDGGFIAYFNFHKSHRPTNIILSVEELRQTLSLRIAKRTADGTLYRASAAAPATTQAEE